MIALQTRFDGTRLGEVAPSTPHDSTDWVRVSEADARLAWFLTRGPP